MLKSKVSTSLNLSLPPGRRGPSRLYKLMLGPQRRLGHTSDGRLHLFCSQNANQLRFAVFQSGSTKALQVVKTKTQNDAKSSKKNGYAWLC